jgi:type VI protein secretion system component Hcp
LIGQPAREIVSVVLNWSEKSKGRRTTFLEVILSNLLIIKASTSSLAGPIKFLKELLYWEKLLLTTKALKTEEIKS